MTDRPPCTVRPDGLVEFHDPNPIRIINEEKAARLAALSRSARTFEVTRCDECNAVSEVEVELDVLESTPGPDLCLTCAAKPRGATDG